VPLLVSLGKKTGNQDSLDIIKGNDGAAFSSDTERSEYIRKYYEDLYRLDNTVGGTIEDFLGPAICNHPTVTGSKLSVAESTELDLPLGIGELDTALENANLRSAPGIDGYSYRFISEFWYLFGTPLFFCARDGLDNNNLPEFFKTAVLKLIPKKGDLSKIGNWRPISLLSNFYKIVSRAINTRIQKVVDRVLSRAQKGFTKSRQIHEVIINCTETMDYCSRNGIKGVIASIDQSKAFDSVSHSYMEKVYEFFGFGARIRSWLLAIGTGRSACIRLSDGELTPTFDLEKGPAQGDSPSPLLYNLAAQIQIFWIELDDNIEAIVPPNINPLHELAPVRFYKGEGLGQITKNESFADDSSNLILLKLECLTHMKKVLCDFRVLSGLSCNIEKSFIMRIGDLCGTVSAEIRDLGFSFADKIKLLGFTLQNYGDMVATNFESITTKIDSIIRFWERFYLSLPGKITIYKTFLLSQINYIATIMTPNQDIIASLEKKEENFVVKGFSLSADKIYSPVKVGGLGMFKLSDFIVSLQCSWIKRCAQSCNDNWKHTLVNLSGGDVTLLPNDNITKNAVGCTLTNLVDSYSRFKSKFTVLGNNYLTVPIYCNSAFGYDRGNRIKLDAEFFGIAFPVQYRDRVLKLTWSSLTVNGVVRTKLELDNILGESLTREQYCNLKIAYRSAVNRYQKLDGKSATITEFLARFKKGSRNFRNVIGYGRSILKVSDSRQCKTFVKLIDCLVPVETCAVALYTSWSSHFLNMSIRVFLFKFYNNILGINTRVANFNPNINGSCTFCSLNGPFPAPAETFSHVFFDCIHVQSILVRLHAKYLCNFNFNRNSFFITDINDKEGENWPVMLFFDIVRYNIWQNKLEKKPPIFQKLCAEIQYTFETIYGTSAKVYDMFNNCNYFQKIRDGEHMGRWYNRRP
jgi:hypothetical protein